MLIFHKTLMMMMMPYCLDNAAADHMPEIYSSATSCIQDNSTAVTHPSYSLQPHCRQKWAESFCSVYV